MVFFVSEGGGFTGLFKQRNRNNTAKNGPEIKNVDMDMRKEAEVAVFRLFRVEGVSNKSPK